MKHKKYVMLGVVGALLMVLSAGLLAAQNRPDGSTRESRELILRGLSKLDGDVHIRCEIEIDGYVVSGYASANHKHGLAIFEPQGDGRYKHQSHMTREEDTLVFMTAALNNKLYNFFWANKADLDYAEITYTLSGVAGKTLKLDAKDNAILYTEAPAKDFTAEYAFVDKNGRRYN